MKKIQKRSRAEATFAFGDAELTYSFRSGAVRHETVADYFDIKPARKFTSRRDWSQLQYGFTMAATGLAAMAAQAMLFGATPLSALWLAPGIALIVLFAVRQNHFRIFQAAGAPLWIIEDRQSSDLVAEIELRRRNRIADIYGPLNLANDPQLEIGKIEWLVVESVLTRDEADRQIGAIHAHIADRAAAAEEKTARPWAFPREAIAV